MRFERPPQEPSFRAFAVRAQRTVGRGQTIGRWPDADKVALVADRVSGPPRAIILRFKRAAPAAVAENC
jgi:hypothetical protein